jgi:hypothetical protein
MLQFYAELAFVDSRHHLLKSGRGVKCQTNLIRSRDAGNSNFYKRSEEFLLFVYIYIEADCEI